VSVAGDADQREKPAARAAGPSPSRSIERRTEVHGRVDGAVQVPERDFALAHFRGPTARRTRAARLRC